ncbi:toll/interleukin-1 receptor domain-containing protein [Derxia lacustris]|uniref:toll/interleukin-1 receptor domain-containing protein n=1 Tax=Derxia lacustris TaxID=764842 RepID=UPI000A170363|nr:toll/interleukin-1 receptor domain-containing protein [Derxia lacustris]
MNTKGIFLSHNHADKAFVRRLAIDLDAQGIQCWLDEAEIKIGDSLIEKIRTGIDEMDFVAIILSPASVNSSWVQREMDVAMNQEIAGRRIKVLPIMYRKCELPGFLLGKRYADFQDESRYMIELEGLVRSMDIVFNRKAFVLQSTNSNLGIAIDKALRQSLPLLPKPFHRPFQYVGCTVQQAAELTGGIPNSASNIIIDTNDCHLFLEAEGNFISYAYIEIKCTAPRYQNTEFDSEPILEALSINPNELEFIRKSTHAHIYYDHRRRLKVNVACLFDGAPFSVGFSSKYYGM